MSSHIPSIPPDHRPSNKSAMIFYKHKITFTEYISILQYQFEWLAKYIPLKNLKKYIQLVAFDNYKILKYNHLNNIQLKILDDILALYDLNLSLEQKKIKLEVIDEIDAYLCKMTNFACKRGLITETDIVINKLKILRNIIKVSNLQIEVKPDMILTPKLKLIIQSFFSISMMF